MEINDTLRELIFQQISKDVLAPGGVRPGNANVEAERGR